MLQYKCIGLTVKSGLTHKDEAVHQIVGILKKLGVRVCMDIKRCRNGRMEKGTEQLRSFNNIDLLLVIGGDGTILRTVREMDDFSIPILSVNWGTVGFLAETNLSEADQILPLLLSGGGALEERSLLAVEALRGTKKLFSGFALNEAVIAQGTIARIVNLRTQINGENLTTFHADGLIIATPTGSTAYSLAAGGPVVHPGIEATILTPINPHSFSQKPIVLGGQAKISVEVMTKKNKFRDAEVVLTIDGQVYVPLRCGDIIRVTLGPKKIRFLRRRSDTFFETLRRKLKWGEHADEAED
ncbi:MAG: NAD(+)/NADH kinase [Candidatus Peregrinibacteria bacterium]